MPIDVYLFEYRNQNFFDSFGNPNEVHLVLIYNIQSKLRRTRIMINTEMFQCVFVLFLRSAFYFVGN